MPDKYVEKVIKKIIRDVGGDRQRLKKRLLQKAKVDQKFLHRLTKPFLTGILSKVLRDMGQNMDQPTTGKMNRPVSMDRDQSKLSSATPDAPKPVADQSLDKQSLDRVLQAMADKDQSRHSSKKLTKSKKGVSKDHIDALTRIAKKND